MRKSLIPVTNEFKGQRNLSDLQIFVASTFATRAKLRAQLAWLNNHQMRGRLSKYARPKAEVEAELAALEGLIAARRRRERLAKINNGPQV